MKLSAILLGGALLFTTSTLGLASPGAYLPGGQWQRYGNGGYGNSYDPLRSLVDRTQIDLRDASDLERHKGDPHNRYSDAQGHLSTFDRKLTQGKFDKGELKKSIEKIQDILNKNVLQSSSRDALLRDVDELQRAHRGRY